MCILRVIDSDGCLIGSKGKVANEGLQTELVVRKAKVRTFQGSLCPTSSMNLKGPDLFSVGRAVRVFGLSPSLTWRNTQCGGPIRPERTEISKRISLGLVSQSC